MPGDRRIVVPLRIVRGEEYSRVIVCYNPSLGNQSDLAARIDLTGKTVRLTIKAATSDLIAAIVYAAASAGDIVHETQSGSTLGKATWTMPAADTEALAAAQRYVYDVWLGDQVVVDNSPVHVEQGAGSPDP